MSTPPLRTDEVPARLRALRAEAGDPSYAEVARRVTALRTASGREGAVSRATVYDCFRDGRKRFDTALIIAIVRALARDEATARAWASALAVLGQRIGAAAVVTVTDALPAPAAPFVGRARELAALTGRPGAHWISAMPGAGKTALAVQAAREAIDSGAADGAVVADLRGHSPVGPPADPQAVVRAALRVLGDRSGPLPAASARRLLRDLLRAQRRVLLLDDAASLEQVEAIVPDPPGMVIVTSRIVAAAPRFRPMELPLFAPYESLALLDALAGRAAIERDPRAAEELLQLTEHQPLAVSITASRVAAAAGWTLAEHLELARARRAGLRLDAPVARSLEATYRVLSEPAQRLLRGLAAHPVALLDGESIRVIADAAADEVDAALAELARHSLITRSAAGAVEMHELVRVHAADRGLELDPASRRRAAAERLHRSVIDRAWSAHLGRSRSRQSAGRAPRTAHRPAPATREEAEATFTDDLDLLLHVALHASADDGPAPVNLIAETLDDALHRAGRADDAERLFREALRVARERGDAEGELRALVDLGATLTHTGRSAEAEAVLSGVDRALPGWPAEAPLALGALGTSLLAQGRTVEARVCLERGIEAALGQDDLWREGLLWNSMALLQLRTGELAACRASLERSTTISARCGDLAAAARGHVNLAKLLLELDDPAAAAVEAQHGLTAMESLGHVPGTVVATSNLAASLCALGNLEEAAELAERGLGAARAAGMQQAELELLRTLGGTRLGRGAIETARATFDDALRLARSLGDRIGAADCLEDLGDCARAAGDEGTARRRWEGAAAERATAGSPAGAVLAKLSALPAPVPVGRAARRPQPATP
ncbi:tetratricopeptide repeat protein [Agrococcus baldri]|uniref:AAA+ ATPase domain-containing protein n=1 Tax=Agrococcus baldri TaxID=153730 RepID=A0AA87UY56_9MICO|nr:tetratricopeptide repeat protein [Agrococcus baldri]GEK81032.1 hypothetical protein ABA31_23830 [Agrococcus baldri]